jgi:hypothetical protein
MDPVAAKEFLIKRVLEEASVENIELTEVEQKMLHFTELHPSLPDTYEIAAEFEQSYAPDEYEAKIAALLRNARSHDKANLANKAQVWDDALAALRNEDHYILVMTSQALRPAEIGPACPNHRVRDLLIYIAVGLCVVILLILFANYR